jgi:hypothetical protein
LLAYLSFFHYLCSCDGDGNGKAKVSKQGATAISVSMQGATAISSRRFKALILNIPYWAKGLSEHE